jgi:hypothetical protein
MLGNLVPDDPLPTNLVHHNEGAHIFVFFTRQFFEMLKERTLSFQWASRPLANGAPGDSRISSRRLS